MAHRAAHRRRHARSRTLIRRAARYGLTDLEAVLATLRLAGISYVAWDTKKGEVAGTGRSFDPASAHRAPVHRDADGEPVLTASDLEEFEGRYGTAEALIEGIRDVAAPADTRQPHRAERRASLRS